MANRGSARIGYSVAIGGRAVKALIRRLAEISPGELPFISAYLDVRPEATGQRPALRSGLIVLRDRMREVRRTYLPRGPKLESFDADAERIERWVSNEMQAATEGVAIFACSGRGAWETLETGAPFENQVTSAEAPDLYQLARFSDEYETAIAAVVDTNTARIFVYRSGDFFEVDAPDDDPVHYRKRHMGGWSQKRYQRHIDNHRRDFAEEIGRAIVEVCDQEHAQHIVIAGDEPAITPLLEQLPKRAAQEVEQVVHIDKRTSIKEIAAEIEPILRRAEGDQDADAVARLVGELRRGGLARAGIEGVREALHYARVDELIIDDAAPFDEDARADLVRQASATDAEIQTVRGNAQLLALGGVAAMLRYALPSAA